MSGSNEQATTSLEGEINDELVRDYLKANGDFLQRNPDMLDYLHIAHASGSAISLVEKQVSVLRERNIEMRRRLNTLTANARENDALYERTRSLVLKLLEARDLPELYHAFNGAMAGDFEVEHASLILFGDPEQAPQGCRIESVESARIEIGALLRSNSPMCGALRQQELGYLFPDAGDVGSAAVMPLQDGSDLGLIAVGSSDANRYSSNMGTLFLHHLADVIVRLLPHLRQGGA